MNDKQCTTRAPRPVRDWVAINAIDKGIPIQDFSLSVKRRIARKKTLKDILLWPNVRVRHPGHPSAPSKGSILDALTPDLDSGEKSIILICRESK